MTDNADARMTPILVLTRPEAQARKLAAKFGAQGQVIVAPIMEIRCVGGPLDLTSFEAVILTSANAVPCAPSLTGIAVHCVGARTAVAVRDAGGDVRTVALNADDLVHRVSGPGPLLHLHGEHTRGAVAQRLCDTGTETHSAVIYRQLPLPLTEQAQRAIEGELPVVLPLYSPRSARLVGKAVRPGPQVHVLALSEAVAGAWIEETGLSAEICDVATGAAMDDLIVAALRRMSP